MNRKIILTKLQEYKHAITKRFNSLVEMYEHLKSSMDINNTVFMNYDLLHEVLVSYFLDIIRLKDFHNCKKINFVKIAGYMVFWIAKLRPIQIIQAKDKDITGDIRRINEYYAAHVGLSFIANLNEPLSLDNSTLKIYNTFREELLYSLVYRVITPQMLELIYSAFFIKVPFKLFNIYEENNY